MTTIEQSRQSEWSSQNPTRHSIFSVDDHVLEHPDVWTSRLSTKTWGDRIPRLETDRSTGNDSWVIDGQRHALGGIASVGAVQNDRAVGPDRWHDVGLAAYVPKARLVAMDVDGVSDSVLYPLVAGVSGQRFASITDAKFERDLVAAYNDYIIDEWVAQSPRFVGQAIVPIGDIDFAVAEIVRSVARGHRGIIFPGAPSLIRKDLPHFNDEHWDPIWRAAEELGVPVAIHSGASERIELPPHEDFSPALASALEALTGPISSSFLLNNLLWSGLLTRFPTLKVVFAETTFAYAAFILETAKHYFRLEGEKYCGMDISPADQFRRQVYLTGWYDRTGFETREHIGVGNMLWSTNFPLPTSCWPDSSAVFASASVGVPSNEQADILQNNARSIYRP